MTRTRRQAILKDILSSAAASTQEALVNGLAKEGIEVTQATVSRDLAAIGAVRGPNGYHLPDAPNQPADKQGDTTQLHPVLRDHVIRISPAASIVVIHTAPGHANFVASEFDAVRPTNMVGCLAGDDTIFIATPSNKAATTLAQQLSQAIEGDA
jgi:transcriptional regulator of arginine metabolism